MSDGNFKFVQINITFLLFYFISKKRKYYTTPLNMGMGSSIDEGR